MRTTYASVFCIGVVCLVLTGCGGGGGGGTTGTGPTNPPPSQSFTISLSPGTVSLTQGSPSQTVQVSVAAQNGFTGSVSVTTASLPPGVTASPSSLSVTSSSPGTLTLSASATAPVVQQAVKVTGTSGTLTSSASLQINVTAAPIIEPFHSYGGTLIHGFYDESRQLLYATNPGLNELDVISGVDYSIKARVPLPMPWGIDQMADGKTLVIGTAAQEIITVDQDTFAVTQHPYSALGTIAFSLFFPNVVALANGKVLMIGQEQGIDSSNILEGGQYLYEWDSAANSFSQLEPTPQTQSGVWEVDSLARSADHKWAAFSADQFYLYSSDSDSLTAAPLTTVNPPANTYGVRGYALNSDGTEIAVASATQVTFLNRSLDVLASTGIPGAFQLARTSVEFSADDTKLFLQYDSPMAIEQIDAGSYTVLGYNSGTVNMDTDNLQRLLTTDAEGRAYVGISGGLRLVDLTKAPLPNPANANFSGPYCPFIDAMLPLNSSQQVQLPQTITGESIYVGGQPATFLDGGATLSIPASSVAGVVDEECVDSSGSMSVSTGQVSYGVVPVALSANLLPATGNPGDYLFGYGFSPGSGQTPSISVGGQSALKVTALSDLGIGTLQGDLIKVPNGSSGESVNIEVTSSLGSGTLASAATYFAAPTIIPATGLLQLIYDTHRSVLYALKATEVDVLDGATLNWKSPLTFPASANGVYTTMALTPDGSKLVVSGLSGANPQVVVLDPDNSVPPSVLTYTGAGGTAQIFGSIAISQLNQVIMAGGPGLVLDLSTSTFSLLRSAVGDVVRASADGSHLYGAALNVNSGTVYSIDPATYAVQSEGFGYLFWTDLAVSPDGSQFAAVNAPPDGDGDIVGFFNSSLQYLNANVYPELSPPDDTGVLGATFSPGGQVLVVALGDSIELWDAALGTLRARLMTPEELHLLVYPEGSVAPVIALDSTGQTIYAMSASGLTVLSLPQPMDQIPNMNWSSANVKSGIAHTPISGILTPRMAAMNPKRAK
jgi:hypothetical protein